MSKLLFALLVLFIEQLSSQRYSNVDTCRESVGLCLYSSFEENGFDPLILETDVDIDWTIHSDATRTSNTGPSSGYYSHSYAYLEASGNRIDDVARMVTNYTWGADAEDTDVCVRFAYHMYGRTMGSLQVYITETMEEVFYAEGNLGDQWFGVEKDLKLTPPQQIAFQAARGYTSASDLAIDNVWIEQGKCNQWLPISCGFEEDFCSFTHTTTNEYDEEWWRNKEAPLEAGTGPSTGYNSQYYCYAISSSNDQARLESPPINYSGDICIRLVYHLWRNDTGVLRVMLDDHQYPILEVTGSEQFQWQHASRDATITRGQKVILVAEMRGSSAYVAIDDVLIEEGRCSKGMTGEPMKGEPAVTCDAESVPTSTVPCELVQDTADHLDWHRRSGKTPTGATMNRMQGDMYYPVTGPGYAHQGEFYLFIDASEANYTSTARVDIHTALLVLEHPMYCLRFAYLLNGVNVGSLSVWYTSFEEGLIEDFKIWEMEGDHNSGWKIAEIQFDSEFQLEMIYIVGTVNGGIYGDIAIDDVQLLHRSCTPRPPEILHECNFESSDGEEVLCMMQDDNDDIDFTLQSGPTTSGGTGPPGGAQSGDFYVFAEGGSASRSTAILCFPGIFSSDVCVHFQYNMHGSNMGKLELFTRNLDEEGVEELIWDIRGNQGEPWHELDLSVIGSYSQQICFRATIGLGYRSDIALDTLKLTEGWCKNDDPPL